MHYEMEDLLEQANEIQESLGRSYAVPDELDEADLEAGEHGCRPGPLPVADAAQNSTLCNLRKRRKRRLI